MPTPSTTWSYWEPMITPATITIWLALIGLGAWWIRGMPERGRVSNETKVIDNATVAGRLEEFRLEVQGLRNELQVVHTELRAARNESSRRGDRLNMLRFILMMVIDELAAKDPSNKVLAQARGLLSRVEDEPHQPGNSSALEAAEDTVDKARETVNQVKAEEARGK